MSTLPNTTVSLWPRVSACTLTLILSFLAPTLFAQVPVIKGAQEANAILGNAFTYRIQASNKPTRFSASGLPAGLTLNATSGLIRGTPTKPGTFRVTVTVRNARGVSKAVIFVIKVATKKLPNDMIFVKGGPLPQPSGLKVKKVSSFLIGKYEVTWTEWKKVREWAVKNGYVDLVDVGTGSAGRHPVRNVNWYDVVKWCNAKSEKEGLIPVYKVRGSVFRTGELEEWQSALVKWNKKAGGYRLPTEAEWEYAARGGSSSKRYVYSGSNNLRSVAWYPGNSMGAAVDLGSMIIADFPGAHWTPQKIKETKGRGTWSVGLKAANELGVHDMSGNVWEWCWNSWPNESDVSRTGGSRIRRGGSWWDPSSIPQSIGSGINVGSCSVIAYAWDCDATLRFYDMGFRLVRSSGN